MNRREWMKGAGILGAGCVLTQCAEVGLGPGLSPTFLVRPEIMTRRLGSLFPVTRDYQGLAKLQFSDPVLAMVPESNQVRVGLTTLGGGLGRQFGGGCQLACGLRYDPKNRGVYLENSVIERFDIEGVSPQWTQGFRQIANVVGNEYLERHPVYQVADTFGIGFLKSMRVESGGVRLSFGV